MIDRPEKHLECTVEDAFCATHPSWIEAAERVFLILKYISTSATATNLWSESFRERYESGDEHALGEILEAAQDDTIELVGNALKDLRRKSREGEYTATEILRRPVAAMNRVGQGRIPDPTLTPTATFSPRLHAFSRVTAAELHTVFGCRSNDPD